MELTKTKFKKTDVGLIPEDWDCMELGIIGKFFKGKGIRKDEVAIDGVDCIRYGELYTQYNNVVRTVKSKIPYSVTQTSFRLEEGDILFAGSGETKEGIGKSVAFLSKNLTFAGGDIVVFRKHQMNATFLGYLTNASTIAKQKSLLGQGDAVVHIYASALTNLKIPVPPLTEQKAIATALSDVDEMIAKLEKLIEKKKAIKQGAMQQLLTPPHKGGKRLEGFSGEWVETELSNILTFGSGMDYKHLKKGDIPVYGTGGVMTQVDDFIYDGESVGIGRKGTIDQPVYLSGKFWTVDTLFYTHTFQNCIPLFDYYMFLLIPWKEYNEASGVPSLNKNTLGKIKINLPSTIAEQKSIVQILSTIENSINKLICRKSKLQSIKQGMMQELLTGRTRLV